MNIFGISFLSKLLSDKIPIPKTLDQSLQFLSYSIFQYLDEHFQQALKIVFEHFNEVSVQNFLSLSTDVLNFIFSSDQLKLQNEDQLFSLIINLIQQEENRFSLLNNVHFEFVSSELIISFFKDRYIDQIDFELFEHFKLKLFSEISFPYSEIPSYRYIEKQNFLPRLELDEIYSNLKSYLNKQQKPLDQIKYLIQENKEMKENINQLMNQISQQQNQIQNFSDQLQLMQNNNTQLKNQIQNITDQNQFLQNRNQELTLSIQQMQNQFNIQLKIDVKNLKNPKILYFTHLIIIPKNTQLPQDIPFLQFTLIIIIPKSISSSIRSLGDGIFSECVQLFTENGNILIENGSIFSIDDLKDKLFCRIGYC